MFNIEEIFEEEGLDYVLEEVNVMSGARKFESLDV